MPLSGADEPLREYRSNDPQVQRIATELVLKEATTAKEAGSNRPDRHPETVRGHLIGLILDVHRDHDRSKRLGDSRYRVEYGRCHVDADESIGRPLRAGAERRRIRDDRIHLGRIERNPLLRAFTRAKKDVSADGEQPPPAVAPRSKRLPRPKGPEVRVLNDVFGIRLIACHRKGEPIDVTDPPQRFGFEGLAGKGLSGRAVCRYHVR
jgi:hypothetical protein